MWIRHRLMESLCSYLRNIVDSFFGVSVVVAAALPTTSRAIGADPPAPPKAESWGPREGNFQTRLVPLADHFVLGQPMKFRLKLKNVGQTAVHYDPQQVGINGSLKVLDPEGHPIRYSATSFQTMINKFPALMPGNVVNLFDGLDLDSQYLIVKPGKYSVQFRHYAFPNSNTVEVEVRPGTLPPIKRIAARLLEVLPKEWVLIVHGYAGEPNGSRPVYWDDPPPGREPVRGLPTLILRDSLAKEGSINATFWLSERPLPRIVGGDGPKQTAAAFYGKCPEGYLYALTPSEAAVKDAQWPTFEQDLRKALEIKKESDISEKDRVKKTADHQQRHEDQPQVDLILDGSEYSDADLKKIEGKTELAALWFRNTRMTDRGLQSLKKLPNLHYVFLDGNQITDAGLEHLKALTQLQGLSLDATKITDAGLAKLKGLNRLRHLSLAGTPITDAGLETVGGFLRLDSLNLDGTRITDAGLRHLKGLTKMDRLLLAHTQVTDAGLEYLKGMKDLTELDLDETRVSDEGARRFQQALPQCVLYYKSEEAGRKRWEAEKESQREAARRTSAVDRVQTISQSKQNRHYIVQFDKPGLKRQPLIVIVWKENTINSIGLGGLDTDTPIIMVNGHAITPPRKTKAVYALRPDYSLEKIPLTDSDIKELFSRILRNEERALSSTEEEMMLPEDSYWEKKVDPHLKVVETERKE
jgi:hypothetical protein